MKPRHIDRVQPAQGHTVCEYKGVASYLDLVAGGARADAAAWGYPEARSGYGGWITSRVVGPFKVEPGTRGW